MTFFAAYGPNRLPKHLKMHLKSMKDQKAQEGPMCVCVCVCVCVWCCGVKINTLLRCICLAMEAHLSHVPHTLVLVLVLAIASVDMDSAL
jgi:hypothetical protein